MGDDEGGGDEEDACSCAGTAMAIFGDKGVEKLERVPDGAEFGVDDSRSRANEDTNERGETKSKGNGDELREKSIAGLAGETREIRVVDDEGSEVGDGGHDAGDDGPSQFGPLRFGGLMNDLASSSCSNEGPDEERDTSCGCDNGLDGEEMANFMDREPDEWQRSSPEENETDEIVDSASQSDLFCQGRACSE